MGVGEDPIRTEDITLPSPRRLAVASLANSFFFCLQTLLFLVLTPMLYEVLGEELYGLWSILIALAGFASLANFGIGSVLTKYVAEFHVSKASHNSLSAIIVFGMISLFAAGLSVAILVFILNGWIANRISLAAILSVDLRNAIKVVAIGVVPLFIGQVPRGVLAGLIRYDLCGGLNLAQQTLLLVGTLIIGYHSRSIVSLAIWYLGIQIAICLLSCFVAWHILNPFNFHLSLNETLQRGWIEYSLVSWITSLGTMLFGSADRILVGMLLGPGAAGIYAIATGSAMKLNQALSPLTDVLMPFSSSYHSSGNIHPVMFAFRYGSRLAACLLAAIVVILVLWTEPVLSFWLGPDFAVKYTVIFRILFICYAIFSMGSPGFQISRGLGVLTVPTIITVGSGILVLVFIPVLSRSYGLAGAAFANFAYTLVLAINFYMAKKLKVNWRLTVLKPLGPPLAILGLSVCTALLMDLPLLVKGFLTAILLGMLGLMVAWPVEGRVLMHKIFRPVETARIRTN